MLVTACLTLFVLFVVVVSLFSARKRTPARLYEEIHKMVGEHYFDPSRMHDWQSWKNRFDNQIVSRTACLERANEMIASLNDPFTEAIGPRRRAEVNWEAPEFVNLGVTVATAYEDIDAEACLESHAGDGYSCQYPTITSVGTDSPAEAAGLKAGDVITSIDGQSTSGKSRRQVQDVLRGLMGTSVVLGVERGTEQRSVTLVRTFVKRFTALAKMLDDDIGYLRIAHFAAGAEEAAAEQAARLSNARTIIVDVRNNPGGNYYSGVRTASLFIKQGVVARTESRLPGPLETPKFSRMVLSLRNGLLFEEPADEGSPQPHNSWTDGKKVSLCRFADKPVIVLVNENTASAAETFAGALRDTAGATLLGVRTFGKGVGQETFHVAYLIGLKITTFKTFTPSGFWPGDAGQERHGITPDVVAPTQFTLFDFGTEQDEHLRRAISLLKEQMR